MFTSRWLLDISEVIDIAIVAVFLYVGLVWFKKTRTFLVAAGIVMLGLVYALAQYLNLYLTTVILQGFFAVLLIAIIVIFQEELRHFFERVALWGLGRHKRHEATPLVAILVGAALDLARAKVGALIVVTGRDPVGRHIEGGTRLDGKPSESLIRCIFGKTSPIHDGAVIIKEGRISRFSAYLPLSKNLHELKGKGTRHAAALGIAERCDAMCIVVSEERGTISVAQGGAITETKDSEKLGAEIEEFLINRFPPHKKRRLTNFVRQNLREKTIALLLAVGFWVVFAYKTGVVQRDFMVPIEFMNFPSGLVIERLQPRSLTVTLSGEKREFKLFDPHEVKVTVDMSDAKEGRQHIFVKEGQFSRIPRALSLDSIRPPEIEIVLRRNAEKEGAGH